MEPGTAAQESATARLNIGERIATTQPAQMTALEMENAKLTEPVSVTQRMLAPIAPALNLLQPVRMETVMPATDLASVQKASMENFVNALTVPTTAQATEHAIAMVNASVRLIGKVLQTVRSQLLSSQYV